MATVSERNGKTAPDAADIADQIETLRADLAELTTTVSGYARGKGQAMRDDATHRAEKLGQDASRAASQAADQAGDMVRQNPATALGAAAAVGFLVGFLSTRR